MKFTVLIACALLTAAALVAPTNAEKAAGYGGKWSVSNPRGGIVMPAHKASCDDPVVIATTADGAIRYESPKGYLGAFAIKSVDGFDTWRNAERGPGPGDMMAEWKDADSFLLAAIDESGRANWGRSFLLTRCPAD